MLAWLLVFAGCAAQTRQPTGPCTGKKTADEAITELNQRKKLAKPIRATGQCLLQYRFGGKGHKENFPVKLWINPPNEVYLQGDIAFDAAGLVLGSNADEFWFWLKPKEISSFWSGTWAQAGARNGLALSPSAVLEAFGDVDLSGGDWSLTHGRFDILWLHNEEGELLERVYIEPCDYVVAKIERLNAAGDVFSRAEFADYEKVADGFFVPKMIKIAAIADDGSEGSAQISLGSVQMTQFSAEQEKRLFVRPEPLGFEHVYTVIDGSAVEQMPQ